MKSFIASTVSCYEQDGVLVVALGDDPQAPDHYMIMTRLDDEDHVRVEEGIGFQTDQSEYEMADAIDKVMLRTDSLEVIVKPEFAGFFGGLSVQALLPPAIHESPAQFDPLKNALEAIFSTTRIQCITWCPGRELLPVSAR